MAEKLESFRFTGAGKPGRFPWNEWFDGSVWKLTRGVDFEVAIPSFRSTVCNAARRLGGRARTQAVGEDVLVIQYYTTNTEKGNE